MSESSTPSEQTRVYVASADYGDEDRLLLVHRLYLAGGDRLATPKEFENVSDALEHAHEMGWKVVMPGCW